MGMEGKKTITARDLLHTFMELRLLTPNLKQWTQRRLKDNPPRLLRLQRLQAMFAAFGIPFDPAAFIQGKFINVDHPGYEGILKEAIETLKQIPGVTHPKVSRGNLPYAFEILFQYRERVEQVLSFLSGTGGVTSDLFTYVHRKIACLNKIIRDHLNIIDDILTTLISPQGQTFTEEELSRLYGYPIVDLWDIDALWF